jgi:hypothetical protein
MIDFVLILEDRLDTKRKLSSEKDAYKLLEEFVFNKAYKLYTPILRGFPDYIVIELKEKYSPYLKAGFYEIKFNNGKLTPYQVKFLSSLALAFPVYLVQVYQDYRFVVKQIVVHR